MSAPRTDYARLPEAADIVAMYTAGEQVANIVRKVGFSDQKIRLIVAARGAAVRRVGRPRAQHLTSEMEPIPEPIAPRDPCPFCNVKRNIGCRHFPVVHFEEA